MINLEPEYAAKAIARYLTDSKGKNHRYRSWEHCYLAFAKARKDLDKKLTPDYDLLALHLSNYLGSWGMYRNSFLFKRDYRTHLDNVQIILSQEYNMLWTFPAHQKEKQDKSTLNEYWTEIDKIHKTFILSYNYGKARKDLDKKDYASVTETLITKILLGTYGCIPATDRLYKDAMKAFGGTQRLGKRSYAGVVKYYWSHWDEISNHLLEGISLATLDDPLTFYPPMKLMDMCFWQIGNCIELHDRGKAGAQKFCKLPKDKKYDVLDNLLK